MKLVNEFRASPKKAILPAVVAAVLVLLAFRAIRKDHILTQFDRLR